MRLFVSSCGTLSFFLPDPALPINYRRKHDKASRDDKNGAFQSEMVPHDPHQPGKESAAGNPQRGIIDIEHGGVAVGQVGHAVNLRGGPEGRDADAREQEQNEQKGKQ